MRKYSHHVVPVIAKLVLTLALLAGLSALGWFLWIESRLVEDTSRSYARLSRDYTELSTQFASAEAQIAMLKSEDQRVRNDTLQETVASVQGSFKSAVGAYETILRLRDGGTKVDLLEKLFAQTLDYLRQLEYTSASATLKTLDTEIGKLNQPAQAAIPANAPVDNTPPSSGFKQQTVDVNGSRFLVNVIAADLGSTRVVVETASDGDCADNCPVDSLASFVAKAGGYAGINGPYFCPEAYPSCAGKKNSFDTLIMNKNKTYFNSSNNVYSSVPAAIFSAGSARFVGASSEWGRDTGVDSVIAGQPLLLLNGEIRFGGDDEVKRASRGARSFIASKGSTVYIGVVYNANVAEVALVLHAMGLENAINLDSGGSTALYSGGRYIAGPGRNTPFGIVLVGR